MTLRNDKSNGSESPKKKTWRLPRIAAVATALVLTTGVVATKTFAGHWGGSGWHHGAFMHGPVTQADADKRIKRAVSRMSVVVDATQEQQDKLIAVFSAAASELLPMRNQMKASKQAARTLLTGATIDRTAIESHRAMQVERMDKASKRLAQAFADAAEVLTPAQRAKLGELMR